MVVITASLYKPEIKKPLVCNSKTGLVEGRKVSANQKRSCKKYAITIKNNLLKYGRQLR